MFKTGYALTAQTLCVGAVVACKDNDQVRYAVHGTRPPGLFRRRLTFQLRAVGHLPGRWPAELDRTLSQLRQSWKLEVAASTPGGPTA